MVSQKAASKDKAFTQISLSFPLPFPAFPIALGSPSLSVHTAEYSVFMVQLPYAKHLTLCSTYSLCLKALVDNTNGDYL